MNSTAEMLQRRRQELTDSEPDQTPEPPPTVTDVQELAQLRKENAALCQEMKNIGAELGKLADWKKGFDQQAGKLLREARDREEEAGRNRLQLIEILGVGTDLTLAQLVEEVRKLVAAGNKLRAALRQRGLIK